MSTKYEEAERELSKAFDENIAPMVLESYSENDTIAFNEAFSCWIDSMERDSEISDDVANNVCYVGKYSD